MPYFAIWSTTPKSSSNLNNIQGKRLRNQIYAGAPPRARPLLEDLLARRSANPHTISRLRRVQQLYAASTKTKCALSASWKRRPRRLSQK